MSSSVNFTQLGLKLVRGRWVKTSVENFKINLKLFYDFVIELYIRSSKWAKYYDRIDRFDVTIDKQSKFSGRRYTPDVALYDAFGNLEVIIEFKCSLSEFNKSFEDAWKSKVKEQYGKLAEIDFIVANKSFYERIKESNLRFTYLKLLDEILDVKNQLPPKEAKEYFEKESNLPSLNEVLENHPRVQAIPDEALEHEEYHSIEVGLRELLNNIERMEKFTNYHFLGSDDMAQTIPEVKRPNIYKEHPWNRDKNYSKYKEKLNGNWGHKANTLYQLPPSNYIKDCELQEFLNVLPSMKGSEEIHATLRDLIIIETTCKPELESVKAMLEHKAYIKGEASKAERLRIAEMYKINEDRVATELEALIKIQVQKIQEKTGIKSKLSRRGHPVLKTQGSEERTGINRKSKRSDTDFSSETDFFGLPINTNKNGETVIKQPIEEDLKRKTEFSRIELSDWFKDNKIDLSDLFKEQNLTISDFTNAYPFNNSLNDLSNLLFNENRGRLEEILRSRSFSSIYSYIQFYRAIVMAAPRLETKNALRNEFVITKHPDGYYIVLSPSPNEISTGVIYTFGRISKRPPEWFTPLHINHINKRNYFISEPFRINLKIAVASNAHLGSYLGTVCLAKSYDFDIYKDTLFTSFYWAYTRQLSNIADMIYLYCKNATMVGNFGRDEIGKKWAKMMVKDIRISTILFRMKNEFTRFQSEVKLSLLKQPHSEVKDFVFNCFHTGWQSFLLVDYLKQCFPKDDGYDSKSLMGDFFRDEMGYQTMYESSPFHVSKVKPENSLDPKVFYEKLFVNDFKWTEIAYSPDMCYSYMTKVINKARERDGHISPYRDWLKPALLTSKQSKCNTFSNHDLLYGVDEELVEESKTKSKYKGLSSKDLPTALAYEHKLMKDHIEKGKFMGKDSPYFNLKAKVGDKMISLVEMSLFEFMIYPEAVILTMVDKVQTGFGKRAFFVQMVFNRNMNKVWDETFRPLLLTDPMDMILTPGMEKYMKFQDHMKEMKTKSGSLLVSKDATKFGDTYDLNTFKIQIFALHDTGYISKNEAKMLLGFHKNLEQRIILMPWQNAEGYTKCQNREVVSDKERKWAMTFSNFADKLDDPTRFKGFATESVFPQEVLDNPCFHKSIGWTLGVFNMAGDQYTIIYTKCIKDLWKLLGLKDVFRGLGHSDDAEDITVFECPTRDYFEARSPRLSNCATRIIRLCLDKGQQINKIGTAYTILNENGDLEEIPLAVLGKIHIIFTLFVPRLFSQRPSPLKWMFGETMEVIQVICHNQNVYVPLVRYASSIGKDLPGKSPGSDSYMMSGRIYDVVVNHGTINFSTLLILALNFLISDMYGMHQIVRNVLDPPEVGGLWWALPGRILEEGFVANEVRLQSINDAKIKRKLGILINVETFWNKQKNTDISDDKFILEALELDDVEPTLNGGVEYRRDFRIKFNRKLKTDKDFTKLASAYKEEIDREYENLAKRTKSFKNVDDLSDNPNQKVRDIKKDIFIQITSGSKSSGHWVINLLSKFTSTVVQESQYKISADAQLTSRLGYIKRKFPNPFSEQYAKMLNTLINLPIDMVTIAEVWNAVDVLSSIPMDLPVINLRGVDLIKRILSTFIAEELNLFIDIAHLVEVPQHIDNAPVKYVRVKDKRSITGLGRNSNKALAAIYEMMRSKDTIALRDTVVIKYNPRLHDNEYFSNQVESIRGILVSEGFNARDILDHFRLIARLLMERNFEGIAKLPGEYYRFDTATSYLWKNTSRLIVLDSNNFSRQDFENLEENIQISKEKKDKEENAPKIIPKIEMMNVRFDRLISSVLWANKIHPQDYPLNGTFVYKNIIVSIPEPKDIFYSMDRYGFNKVKSNMLLMSMLWHKQRKNINFVISRNIQTKKTEGMIFHSICLQFCLFKFINITVLGEIAIQRKNRRINKEREIVKKNWAILVSTSEFKTSLGQFYLIVAKVLNYWMISKEYRIEKVDDIEIVEGYSIELHEETQYTYFDSNREMSKAAKPAEGWRKLAILESIPDHLNILNASNIDPHIGVISTVDITFHNEDEEDYIITPWNLGSEYTGLAYYYKNEILLQDIITYKRPVSNNKYISYHRTEGNADDYWAFMYEFEVSEAITIAKTLLNLVGANLPLNFDSTDYSLVIGAIRTVEINLGVPFHFFITIVKEIYPNLALTMGIKKFCFNILADLNVELKGTDALFYIGTKTLIRCLKELNNEYGSIPNNSFNLNPESKWLADFYKLIPKDKNKETPNLITEEPQIDNGFWKPNFRNKNKAYGNMPISALTILSSSIPGFFEFASYFKEQQAGLFTNISVDAVYFINAYEKVEGMYIGEFLSRLSLT